MLRFTVRAWQTPRWTATRAYYCGLCRTLGRRYGRTGQLALSCDLAFVAILLTALYEPETQFSAGRCAPHPLKNAPARFQRISGLRR